MPGQRLGLIQTIGFETLPAVSAAVALRPAVLAHVHTPESSQASRRAAIAIRQVLGAVETLHSAVDPESVLEGARGAVKRLAEELRDRHGCERMMVHVTGSTKLVAIGAYEAARELGLECMYLELPRGDEDGVPQVISLGTGRLDSDAVSALGVDPSKRLNLEIIAQAHGYELTSAGEDFRPFVGFARAALEDPDAEAELHLSLPAPGGSRAPWPDEPLWQEWRTAFAMPAPLRELALEAGIVEEIGAAVRIVEPGAGVDRNERRRVFERNASLLRGAWLEVAVVDAMLATPHLRDVRWSVEAEQPRPMEHDVLALKGATLVVGSAKRSPQPGIFGHLRELVAHARRLGGEKAIPVLAIARSDRRRSRHDGASVMDDLREVAEALGVRFADREALLLRRLSV